MYLIQGWNNFLINAVHICAAKNFETIGKVNTNRCTLKSFLQMQCVKSPAPFGGGLEGAVPRALISYLTKKSHAAISRTPGRTFRQ